MALSISNVAPVEPTQDQLAARLNPQPTTTYTPSQGLFRGVGDYGTTLYSGSGKALNLLDSSLGLYDPSIVGAGAQVGAALQTLQNKYGFDYNSLPSVNIGDYVQQQNKGPNALQYGPSGFRFANGALSDFFTANAPALPPATITSQTTPAAPQGTPGTVPVPQGAVQVGAPAVALPNNGGTPSPQTTTAAPATVQTPAIAGTIAPPTTSAVGQQTPAQIAAAVSATGQQPAPQSAPTIAPAQALPNNGSTATSTTTPVGQQTPQQIASTVAATGQQPVPQSAPTIAPAAALPNNGSTSGTTSGGVQGLIQPPPINTSQNTTNSTFPGLVSATAQSALGNTPIGQNAANIAAQYGQQIANVGQQGARAQAGYNSTGTTPVGEGNAAIQAQTTAAQQSALAQGESAALQGTGQQLTAQNQQTTGLGSAAGLAQPSGTFPFSFNPLTGQFSSSGGGSSSSSGGLSLTYNPQTDATNLAKAVINHQIGIGDAQASLGYAGSVGTGLLNAAIVSQGGNPNVLAAEAAAQSQNAQNVGTQELSLAAAKSVSSTIASYIQSNPSLNPSQASVANALTAWAQGNQLSDPTYQTLYALLDDYTAKLAPVLGVAGSTTNLKTEIASGFINSAAQGQSLVTVMNNLNAQGDATITTQKAQVSGSNTITGANLGNQTTTQTPNGSTNNSAPAGFGWNP